MRLGLLQHRVQRLIEVPLPRLLMAHAAPAVDQKYHLLVPLVLVFLGDEPAVTGGSLPIDLAQAVARSILPELMKILTLTTPLTAANTDLAEPVVESPQVAPAAAVSEPVVEPQTDLFLDD